MKISSNKSRITQKKFAGKAPLLIEPNAVVLESWNKNLSTLESSWRSRFLRAKKPEELLALKSAFFKARFEFEKQLREHSTLPHKTILLLKRRIDLLADEIKKIQ